MSCPNCGYCKECGRNNAPFPTFPNPLWVTPQYWQLPWTTTNAPWMYQQQGGTGNLLVTRTIYQ
jgi:hypothetical protein